MKERFLLRAGLLRPASAHLGTPFIQTMDLIKACEKGGMSVLPIQQVVTPLFEGTALCLGSDKKDEEMSGTRAPCLIKQIFKSALNL